MNKPVMALAEFGRLDVLVNSAGILFVAPLQEFPVGQMGRHPTRPQLL